MGPGGGFAKRLENEELRTYLAINGNSLDPLGLNHRIPVGSKAETRLLLLVAAEWLQKGENSLRIHQTAQKNDPGSFDDCGIFGISLVIEEPQE